MNQTKSTIGKALAGLNGYPGPNKPDILPPDPRRFRILIFLAAALCLLNIFYDLLPVFVRVVSVLLILLVALRLHKKMS